MLVDGEVVYDKGGFFSNFFLEQDVVPFHVGTTECEIHMVEKDLGFDYTLHIRGKELAPTFHRGAKEGSPKSGDDDGGQGLPQLGMGFASMGGPPPSMGAVPANLYGTAPTPVSAPPPRSLQPVAGRRCGPHG